MDILNDVFRIITNISWGPDIAATIVAMVMGMIWYHPQMLGTIWMRETGLTAEKITSIKAKNAMMWAIPITFIIAANIAAFCKHFDYRSAPESFLLSYDLGLIICLFMALHYLYEQRSLKLYAINAGYTLITMSLMGIVIGMLL